MNMFSLVSALIWFICLMLCVNAEVPIHTGTGFLFVLCTLLGFILQTWFIWAFLIKNCHASNHEKAGILIHFFLNFPTVDLIDVSLIQHILSSEQSQISLNMQQITRMLMKLFQRARLEKPGQVDRRAAEFTLSLLVAMYDR